MTDPTPTSTTRRLLRREERQAQLLRAAATAFARGGFAGTSMDDVAAEAGVSRLIVYRNFESKEDLYRAVLEKVSTRLAEEFTAAVQDLTERGWATRCQLVVAREDPDAFRLLWSHASREPAFAEYAEEFRRGAVEFADSLVGDAIEDPVLRRWMTTMTVAYVVTATLAWLEQGDPERDEDMIQRSTDGLAAMFSAWAPDFQPAGQELPGA
jgi:AcrR family transcriptional regulator